MHLMLQQDQADDFVIATGETHTVRGFAELAFGRVGLHWQDYVVSDQAQFRPAEVELLLGEPAKARQALGGNHRSGSPSLWR